MPLSLILNWKLWAGLAVAIALAASHWKAYQLGGAECRTEQAEAALAASEKNRTVETGFNQAIGNLTDEYLKNKAAHAAAATAADNSLRSLRDLLYSTPAPTSASASRANDRAGLESELLGDCAKVAVRLAREADQLEERLVGLQAYVKAVQATQKK